MKKCLSLCCALVVLLLPFLAKSEEEAKPLIENLTSSLPFFFFFPRDEEGYLNQSQWEDEEFIYADHEKGQWLYLSPPLQVEIVRYQGKYKRKPIVWYESVIKSKKEGFSAFSADPEKPGVKLMRPELIAQNHQVVYAQNGDFFTYRTQRDKRPGIIIRNKQVLYDKTNKKVSTALPPLDELAFYDDGLFELHHPGELCAQDYVDKGACDVLSFGPILIRDGQIDPRVSTGYTAREPRSAIGMVAPGHYVGFYIEARNKRSFGCDLDLVAQRMAEKGCQLAINLDGGQTAAMVFMGEPVMKGANYNGYSNTRRQQDIIGIGFSPAVKENDHEAKK